MDECRKYVVNKLKENGFKVEVHNPNRLIIS